MRTQCSSKLLEFEDHGRRRLLAKKLIFLFDFLRVPLRGPSCPFVDIFCPSWFNSGRLRRGPADGLTEWGLKRCRSVLEGTTDRS